MYYLGSTKLVQKMKYNIKLDHHNHFCALWRARNQKKKVARL